MSSYIQNFISQGAKEILPFSFNTLASGGLTLAGQYVPKAVEALSFDMLPKSLGFGAIYTSLAGSLTCVLAKTFAENRMKTQAAKVLLYAMAAFASAYFLPNAARSAELVISKENAFACATMSSLANFICIMLKTP